MIFKICSQSEWQDACAEGLYHGAPIDLQDGFIHFSAAHQVRATAAKHFTGLPGLVLVAFDEDLLGESLKWEPSRGGDLFPHLYGTLQTELAVWVVDLPLDANGQHVFPEDIEA
ncbi:MAG TPA: DUF952 domain-containing protein [Planctomycetaceae bacterium]|nr:DUF952 domain-containing protein [Planctomycetaceae bacterium]